MCGIAGVIDKKRATDSRRRERVVRNMLRLMKHRGFDAHGIKSTDNVSIGHTRLSILDLSRRGDQPFSDENLNSALSFNGELYNHDRLRKKYLDDIRINSNSDTATLFELLKKFPIESVLKKIHGMFAFSFLNNKSSNLVLAIDRFSIKPLYYVNTPEYFAWASEIKAFSALPKHKFQLNKKVIGEYLIFRHVSGPETLFKNIHKLQAGEYLTYNLVNKTIKVKKYYKLQKSRCHQDFLENILSSSVKAHLMGDIIAGVQLSGGVDSSLVALFAQKFSKKKLHTFSIGLNDKKWNEFHYSDFIANKLGTNHHKIIFSKKDFVRLLPRIIYHLDVPITHPNTVPMYILAKEARKCTKVLLTGEGADEVFCGYNRYFQKNEKDKGLIYSNAFSSPQDVAKIFKGHISVVNRKKIVRGLNGLKREDKMSFYDIYTYLPHVLLRQDKAGMAANIENRVPFLYTSVVEMGFNSKTKVGRFGGKTQIKELALKYLPKDLVLRRKCGFGLPISEWLRDKDGLLSHLSNLTKSKVIKEFFDVNAIKQLIEEHLVEEVDNSPILFTLISLSMWHDTFIN